MPSFLPHAIGHTDQISIMWEGTTHGCENRMQESGGQRADCDSQLPNDQYPPGILLSSPLPYYTRADLCNQ